MHRSFAALLLSSSALLTAAAHAKEAAADAGMDAGEVIIVNGFREQREPSGTTALAISVVDTPQSVTVIDRAYLDDFAMDDVNDVLRMVVGVNVEQVETDRTYYNARGFDITSMTLDGLGLPNIYGPTVGRLDTAIYDRIEIVRGANGLLTGTGNPSGTINYLRKRPVGERRLSGELSLGSWGKARAEADGELPLTEDGGWSLRVVGAAQWNRSYLRDERRSRTVFHGVLDGKLTERLSLTLGYTRQDGSAHGVLWGALPLLYSDGTETNFPTGTSTTQDWTSWETHDTTAFAELAWQIADDWQLRTNLTRRKFTEPSRLFYVYGTPDAATGLGLYGWPGAYDLTNKGWIVDAELQGKFALFGREHELTLGGQHSDSSFVYYDYPVPATDPAWGALPPLPDWTGQEVGLPAFGERMLQADVDYRTYRAYGAARLSLTGRLKLIGGFNYIDVRSAGLSFGTDYGRSESAVSPYAGVTYEIAPEVNLYASYSDIFEPQHQIGSDYRPIGSAKGKSLEAGIKGNWLDGRLFGSLAWFEARQSNLAEYDSYDVATGQSLYRGIEARSRGFEAELGGHLFENLAIQGGLAHLSLKNGDGDKVRTYVPRTTATLALRWTPVPALTLGTAIRWQSDIHLDTAVGTINQPSYATVQLQAKYEVSENLAFNLNVANATDKKYLTSLYWEQALYAAPRNFTASVQWKF